eukprot:CAMPEP_0178399882 /NCGR_PEP_ID=MMETSP0689_2-20121128/15505_1 /TAXON_ID=160604 /ORGANISM="Amphidinium massartii, Strain CS-259" /LENGTH=74 /DNA_ID=CAMNT_0020020665 /DNA_START=207 /DNA_END=428 /DNA_ORIENTATION=-
MDKPTPPKNFSQTKLAGNPTAPMAMPAKLSCVAKLSMKSAKKALLSPLIFHHGHWEGSKFFGFKVPMNSLGKSS